MKINMKENHQSCQSKIRDDPQEKTAANCARNQYNVDI